MDNRQGLHRQRNCVCEVCLGVKSLPLRHYQNFYSDLLLLQNPDSLG